MENDEQNISGKQTISFKILVINLKPVISKFSDFVLKHIKM